MNRREGKRVCRSSAVCRSFPPVQPEGSSVVQVSACGLEQRVCVRACVCLCMCVRACVWWGSGLRLGLTPGGPHAPTCTVPCSGDCTPGIPGALGRGPEQRDPETSSAWEQGGDLSQPHGGGGARGPGENRDMRRALCTPVALRAGAGCWSCAGPCGLRPQKVAVRSVRDESPGQKPEFPVPGEQWEAPHFPFRFHSKSRG